jgi:hypothetical protein
MHASVAVNALFTRSRYRKDINHRLQGPASIRFGESGTSFRTVPCHAQALYEKAYLPQNIRRVTRMNISPLMILFSMRTVHSSTS